MGIFNQSLGYEESLKEYFLYLLKTCKSLQNGIANFVIHTVLWRMTPQLTLARILFLGIGISHKKFCCLNTPCYVSEKYGLIQGYLSLLSTHDLKVTISPT